MKPIIKKRLIISVWALVALIAFTFSVLFVSCFIAPSLNGNIEFDREMKLLSTDSDEARILVLSDLQFCNYFEMANAFYALKRTVKAASPDLILTTGDNFGNNVKKSHLNSFIEFMDSLSIPWGVTFGNHDYNADFSMEEYCDALENAKNCIFIRNEIEGSYSNYSYRLSVGGTQYTLICMDTGEDGFTAKHTEWYTRQIEKESNGEPFRSFMFFHIPIKEIEAAASLYEQNPEIGSGTIEGEMRGKDNGSEIFKKVLELGSTKALFFGHDHLNNAHINYSGVTLCYALKTGTNVYSRFDSIGGILLTLGKNEEYRIERIFI